MLQALHPTDPRHPTWMLRDKLTPSPFHRVPDSGARLPEFNQQAASPPCALALPSEKCD